MLLLAIDNVALVYVVASSVWPRPVIASPAFDYLSRVLQVISGELLSIGSSVCCHWAGSVCAGPVLISDIMFVVRIFAAYAASKRTFAEFEGFL